MKPVKIGPMRQRVTLQVLTVSGRDSYGAEIRDWTDLGEYWAEVVTLSGREAVNAQQVQAGATHRVRMRRVREILPDQRFLFRGKTLNILSVDDVEFRGREYRILCQEAVAPAS